MQISILCQSPTCEKQGEAIATITGLAPEMMEDTTLAAKNQGEDRA